MASVPAIRNGKASVPATRNVGKADVGGKCRESDSQKWSSADPVATAELLPRRPNFRPRHFRRGTSTSSRGTSAAAHHEAPGHTRFQRGCPRKNLLVPLAKEQVTRYRHCAPRGPPQNLTCRGCHWFTCRGCRAINPLYQSYYINKTLLLLPPPRGESRRRQSNHKRQRRYRQTHSHFA